MKVGIVSFSGLQPLQEIHQLEVYSYKMVINPFLRDVPITYVKCSFQVFKAMFDPSFSYYPNVHHTFKAINSSKNAFPFISSPSLPVPPL